jgi:phage tail sheath protein FI
MWGSFLALPTGIGFQTQEESGPDQSIARLGTARTAFVGRTLRGPLDQPVYLTNFAEFQHVFGGLWQPSPLGYAVEHFFDNGGREALVVRVANGARPATLTLLAGTEMLNLRAVRPGTREFLRAGVDYDNIPAADSALFNLVVQRVRTHGTALVEDQEIFPRLSMLPGSERFLVDMLAESELVRVEGAIPAQRPDQTLDASSGLATGYVGSNADGDDGAPLTDYDLIGSEVDQTGLFALECVDYFNLLCIPPLSRDRDVGPAVLWVAARYCKARRALFVVDPPSDWHTAEDALKGMKGWELGSENAFMYFPRILAYDKLRGRFESFAPCGAVAGMLARADETSPVWGSARTADAILRPGYRPVCLVTEDKRMRLAALGVNTIQAVRAATRLGVEPRTLAAGSAGAADWQRLASRRLALFILNSVERGTRWAVLTRQHAELAAAATARVSELFEWLHARGCFGSRSLEESYFVICDPRINPADGGEPGAFHLLVGFAAARVGEFHVYRISHTSRGGTVTPVTRNRLTLSQYSPVELEWLDALERQLQS